MILARCFLSDGVMSWKLPIVFQNFGSISSIDSRLGRGTYTCRKQLFGPVGHGRNCIMRESFLFCFFLPKSCLFEALINFFPVLGPGGGGGGVGCFFAILERGRFNPQGGGDKSNFSGGRGGGGGMGGNRRKSRKMFLIAVEMRQNLDNFERSPRPLPASPCPPMISPQPPLGPSLIGTI